jgi:hypothetical protein
MIIEKPYLQIYNGEFPVMFAAATGDEPEGQDEAPVKGLDCPLKYVQVISTVVIIVFP